VLVLVDGTNLVRCSNPARGRAFDDAEERDRQWLAGALAHVCEGKPERLEIELFFDGSATGVSVPGAPSNFRLRFGYDEKADDLILDRVRGRRFQGQKVTVVTADVELGERAKEEGAKWQRFRFGQSLESVVAHLER
jgi:hypothetical protein